MSVVCGKENTMSKKNQYYVGREGKGSTLSRVATVGQTLALGHCLHSQVNSKGWIGLFLFTFH